MTQCLNRKQVADSELLRPSWGLQLAVKKTLRNRSYSIISAATVKLHGSGALIICHMEVAKLALQQGTLLPVPTRPEQKEMQSLVKHLQ